MCCEAEIEKAQECKIEEAKVKKVEKEEAKKMVEDQGKQVEEAKDDMVFVKHWIGVVSSRNQGTSWGGGPVVGKRKVLSKEETGDTKRRKVEEQACEALSLLNSQEKDMIRTAKEMMEIRETLDVLRGKVDGILEWKVMEETIWEMQRRKKEGDEGKMED